jgi:hypothetical protein
MRNAYKLILIMLFLSLISLAGIFLVLIWSIPKIWLDIGLAMFGGIFGGLIISIANIIAEVDYSKW